MKNLIIKQKRIFLFQMVIALFLCGNIVFAQEAKTKEEKATEVAYKKKTKELYDKALKLEKTNEHEATTLYKEVILRDPDFAGVYLKLANIYEKEESDYGSISSAVSFYKKYLELKPKDFNAETLKTKILLMEETLKVIDKNAKVKENIVLKSVPFENTNVFENVNLTEDYLKGRWVSDLFSLDDGRETWIIDIDVDSKEIKAKIYPASAIARASLLRYFSKNQNINNYLDALVTYNANVKIENGELNFKYEIDHHYNPKIVAESNNGYFGKLFTLFNQQGSAFSDFFSKWGDLADGIHDMQAYEWNANRSSEAVHTYAFYEFNLQPVKAGLKGRVKIYRVQKMEKSENVLVDEKTECTFFKVNSNYPGFTFARPLEDKERIKRKINIYKRLIDIYAKESKTSSKAMNDLGYLYLNCFYWLESSSESGSLASGSQVQYVSYWKKALDCFEKAAKQDNTVAMRNLALMYRRGIGIKQTDVIKTIAWYTKAAELGDSDAMTELAALYLGNEHTDYEKAKELCRKAAEQNNSNALCEMGWMFTEGIGVSMNYAVAMDYYVGAANKGNTTALNAIANAYKNGYGINQNYTEAFNLYLKSAKQGDRDAMYELSNMYLTGLGVEKDFFEAMNWRRRMFETTIHSRIGVSASNIPYDF
jgi:TPR repeat protein